MADHPTPNRDAPTTVRPGPDLHTRASPTSSARPRVRGWWAPTPGEVVGLAVLLLGALVASVLWWYPAVLGPGGARAVTGVPPAALVGSEVGAVGPAEDRAAAVVLDPPAAVPEAAVGPVTVHVTGGVVTAGLHRLPARARVGDAVLAAGGLTADADLERINLARPLDDGEHVHVPRIGEDPPPEATPPGEAGGAVGADGRLDLNRATAAELETLPGIGPTRAAAIVEYRERHGPFHAPGDLRDVSGIGEATFQTLAPLVVTR
jgi:competence protein ComEA